MIKKIEVVAWLFWVLKAVVMKQVLV
jgi:hypothetical protein